MAHAWPLENTYSTLQPHLQGVSEAAMGRAKDADSGQSSSSVGGGRRLEEVRLLNYH